MVAAELGAGFVVVVVAERNAAEEGVDTVVEAVEAFVDTV